MIIYKENNVCRLSSLEIKSNINQLAINLN